MDSAEFKSQDEALAELIAELRVQNAHTQRFVSYFTDWRRRFGMSILMGFGTVIGATVMVALLLWILQGLASIEMLRPSIEKVVEIVNGEELEQEIRSGKSPSEAVKDDD